MLQRPGVPPAGTGKYKQENGFIVVEKGLDSGRQDDGFLRPGLVKGNMCLCVRVCVCVCACGCLRFSVCVCLCVYE